MLTVVVSERVDGWAVESDGATDRFDQAHDAYRAGVAEVDRLFGEGLRAQLLMVTGLAGQDRSYEAFVRVDRQP